MKDLAKALEKEGYSNITIEHASKHYKCTVQRNDKKYISFISGTPAEEFTAIKQIVRQFRREEKLDICNTVPL